jgi:multidrug resistance efflux pump
LKDYEFEEQQYRSVVQRERLVNAGALPEEIARSEAQIRAVEQRAEQLQRHLDLCLVRAPVAGTILQLFKHVGEAGSK